MIENIRKYTGLMIVVLVLLFIGLVFMESSAQNLTSGAPAMEVAGKQISQKDFQLHSQRTLEIPSRLPFSFIGEDAQNNPLTNLLGGNPAATSQQLLGFANFALDSGRPERFLANRIAIQKAGLEYGATPGPDEVEVFIENVLFADADGNFDQEAYSDFIEKRAGIGTANFNKYIRDLLTAGNLAEIISGGMTVDPSIVQSLYRNGSQTITAQQVTLESSIYENDQQPTDEEIEAYWNENQEKYRSDERRKMSYIFFEPDWDAALAKAEEEKKKAEEVKKAQEEAAAKLKEDAQKAEEAAKKANEANKADTAPTPAEAPKEPAGDQGAPGAQGEPAETPAVTPAVELPSITTKPATPASPAMPELPKLSAQDKLTPAQKEEAIKALTNKANELYIPLVDASGVTFEQVAEQQKYKIITTELFAKGDAPEKFNERIIGSQIGTLADLAFAIPAEAKNDQRITVPSRTSSGWFIGQLEEVEPSRQLTFEEARVKATVDLKKELARKKLAEEAVTIREKIEALIAGGKSFEEAAKDQKLTYQKLPNLKAPRGGRFAPPAFEAARYTAAGTLAETKFIPNHESPERALLVFVDQREVTTDETYQNNLQRTTDRQNLAIRLAIFQSWLRDRYDENEVKYFIEEDQ